MTGDSEELHARYMAASEIEAKALHWDTKEAAKNAENKWRDESNDKDREKLTQGLERAYMAGGDDKSPFESFVHERIKRENVKRLAEGKGDLNPVEAEKAARHEWQNMKEGDRSAVVDKFAAGKTASGVESNGDKPKPKIESQAHTTRYEHDGEEIDGRLNKPENQQTKKDYIAALTARAIAENEKHPNPNFDAAKATARFREGVDSRLLRDPEGIVAETQKINDRLKGEDSSQAPKPQKIEGQAVIPKGEIHTEGQAPRDPNAKPQPQRTEGQAPVPKGYIEGQALHDDVANTRVTPKASAQPGSVKGEAAEKIASERVTPDGVKGAPPVQQKFAVTSPDTPQVQQPPVAKPAPIMSGNER